MEGIVLLFRLYGRTLRPVGALRPTPLDGNRVFSAQSGSAKKNLHGLRDMHGAYMVCMNHGKHG